MVGPGHLKKRKGGVPHPIRCSGKLVDLKIFRVVLVKFMEKKRHPKKTGPEYGKAVMVDVKKCVESAQELVRIIHEANPPPPATGYNRGVRDLANPNLNPVWGPRDPEPGTVSSLLFSAPWGVSRIGGGTIGSQANWIQ